MSCVQMITFRSLQKSSQGDITFPPRQYMCTWVKLCLDTVSLDIIRLTYYNTSDIYLDHSTSDIHLEKERLS